MKRSLLVWAAVSFMMLAIGALAFRLLFLAEGRPLDVGAAVAAVESSAGDVAIREATAEAKPGSLFGFWADPARNLVTQREPLEGSEVRVVSGTPRETLDYYEDSNMMYEGLPRSAEEFTPEDYDRQLKEVLNDGAPPRSTGGSKQVRGKGAREYEDTLPAEGNRPEVKVTLYVDPETYLVVREEYEYDGGPLGVGGETLVRERIMRSKVPENALVTPERLREILKRGRKERLARIAGLPYGVFWVGERFGDIRLVQLRNDEHGVRLDYAAAADVQGTVNVLTIIVQGPDSESPWQTSPGSRSRSETTPGGRKVSYQVGPYDPDGTETGDAYFEEGQARVSVQKMGEVRDKGGEPLSVLEIVDELELIK